MKRYWKVPAAGVIAFVCVLSLLLDPLVQGARPPFANVPGSARSIGCTVKLLRIKEHRLEIIVGVGHALRIVKMGLSASCGASAGGQRIPLTEIRPGDIVRVWYESPPGAAVTPARGETSMIELIASRSRGAR